MSNWKFDDGGRQAAGFKGQTDDCVVRAIAIATESQYQIVYDDLFKLSGQTPRNGVARKHYEQYLRQNGWGWVPVMKIGSGCTMHVCSEELPPGRVILRLSKHLVASIDGVIHDTHDSSRGGSRCVYGYFKKSS